MGHNTMRFDMKTILMIGILVAASVAGATEYINLDTQVKRSEQPNRIGSTHAVSWSDLYAANWRKVEIEDYVVLSNGFIRISREWVQHPSIAERAIESVVDEPDPRAGRPRLQVGGIEIRNGDYLTINYGSGSNAVTFVYVPNDSGDLTAIQVPNDESLDYSAIHASATNSIDFMRRARRNWIRDRNSATVAEQISAMKSAINALMRE